MINNVFNNNASKKDTFRYICHHFVVESVTPIFKVEFSKHHRASDRKFLSAVMFLNDQIISKNTYTQGNIQKKMQLQSICL